MQADGNFNEKPAAADIAGFPDRLFCASGATLPPDFNRKLHWNSLTRTLLIHAIPDSQDGSL